MHMCYYFDNLALAIHQCVQCLLLVFGSLSLRLRCGVAIGSASRGRPTPSTPQSSTVTTSPSWRTSGDPSGDGDHFLETRFEKKKNNVQFFFHCSPSLCYVCLIFRSSINLETKKTKNKVNRCMNKAKAFNHP